MLHNDACQSHKADSAFVACILKPEPSVGPQDGNKYPSAPPRLWAIFLPVLFFFLLVFASTFEAGAKNPEQNISLNERNVSLEALFKKIEQQTGYHFWYEDQLVRNARRVSISIKNASLEKVLQECLKNQSLTFAIIDKTVVIKRSALKAQVASITPLAEAAAEEVITGRVLNDQGQPVAGATVQVKGDAAAATTTNEDGRFRITVPNASAVLVISYVGYAAEEIALGGRTSVDVTLTANNQSMSEVVVTALGIRKEQRSLGYATSVVKPEELTLNRTTNVMNALQGKIAGVNITAPSTGPGGSSKIRIRGQSSIGGVNNPLIVINGVPVSNPSFGANLNSGNEFQRGGGVSSDAGDGFQSINPDDIESMTVLKGAPAAALYGYRAANGVIMINTKSKGSGQGIGVTYNMNYTNETPLDFTDYQYEYGQGENGVRPTTPNPTSGQWSFGERFQPGMRQVLFNGLDVPYEPQRNIIRDFLRNGQNMTNTVTLAANSEKGGLNLSLGNMESKGIVPNNRFNRRTVNLGFTYDLSDRFTFSGNVNYSNEYNKNPPNVGNQDNTIPVVLYNMANSLPLDVLEANKYDATGREYVYSRFRNRTNPYWVLAEQFNNIRRDRIFGNITLKYDILSWLYIQGRIGQDFWAMNQDYNNFPTGHASRPLAPPGFVDGVFTQENRRFREMNMDFLVSGTKEFGDFGLNVTAGGNQQRERSEINSTQVTDFVVRGLYTVQNGRAKDPTYGLGRLQVNSLYGSTELSYKRMLYLNGTVRNDWFSVLSPQNNSILYPSFSASYIFSENFKPSWLSYGKFRVGYAEAGSSGGVGPGALDLYYGINALLFNGQPVGGISGNTVPNPSLQPSRTAETEAGLEMRLFESRLGIDLSVYRKVTSDQILSAQVSDASGFIDTRINSAKSESKGIEMLLTVSPVETRNFSWDVTVNGSYNKTKVLKLLTETKGERITVGTHVFNGELRHVVGMEMAQVAGFGYLRDAAGNIVYGANGIARRTPDLVLFGSALPKWWGGFTNAFRYKGFQLSFLVDFKLGGKMISGTNFNAVRHGLHKMTVPGRENGHKVIGEGVSESGGKNTVPADVQAFWEVVRTQGLVEPVVYNDGFWKLRQVTMGYDFSKYLPKNWPVKGVRLNLTANNVLLLKKWVDNIDPESFGFSSDNVAGLETTGLPTTRSLGFNLNIRF